MNEIETILNRMQRNAEEVIKSCERVERILNKQQEKEKEFINNLNN